MTLPGENVRAAVSRCAVRALLLLKEQKKQKKKRKKKKKWNARQTHSRSMNENQFEHASLFVEHTFIIQGAIVTH